MQREIVQSTVGETVAVVFCLFHTADKAILCEIGDGFAGARGAAAQMGGLLDDGGGDNLVVLGGVFYLEKSVRRDVFIFIFILWFEWENKWYLLLQALANPQQ